MGILHNVHSPASLDGAAAFFVVDRVVRLESTSGASSTSCGRSLADFLLPFDDMEEEGGR